MRIVSGMRNHVFPVANTTPISVEPRPGREASDPSVGGAVRIGADDDAARPREVPVDHHLMTDAFGEEVRDGVLDAELADHAVQLCGRDGVCRHHVVEAEDDPARVPERKVEASERVDGERAGDVMRHRDIHLGDDGVARVNRPSQAAAEQFLGDGSHLVLLRLFPADDQCIEGFDIQRPVIAAALHLGGEAPESGVVEADTERAGAVADCVAAREAVPGEDAALAPELGRIEDLVGARGPRAPPWYACRPCGERPSGL